MCLFCIQCSARVQAHLPRLYTEDVTKLAADMDRLIMLEYHQDAGLLSLQTKR